MKRIYKELLVVVRTMDYIIFKLINERSLKTALKSTFGRKGGRYRIGDGPWIEGSFYDCVRDGVFKKRR